MNRVLVMAGGTGGHVFPALASACVLRDRGIEVHWLGTQRGMENQHVPAAGFKLHTLNMSGVRGKNPIAMVAAMFKAATAVIRCIQLLGELKPICVLGFGGYVSGPGGLAAKLSRTPLVIHEQNAVAGTSNRLLAKFADTVLTAFPDVKLGAQKNRIVGNPVRADISALQPVSQRFAQRNGRLRLLVLGGSLGAKPINDLMVSVAPKIDLDIWHQAGALHAQAVQKSYDDLKVSVRCEAFVNDMAAAYDWADVVLCRAGALTVAELASAGLGALFVPLPHAIDDHQTANAKWLADAGAGVLLPQADLTAAKLIDVLKKLDRTELLQWALAAEAAGQAIGVDHAAEQVANYCLEAARGR